MIQSCEDKHHFWDQNDLFVLNNIVMVQTTVITFIYLLSLFIVKKFKKFLQRIVIYVDAPFFGPKMVHLPETIFFCKIITIIFIYLLAPSILQNFKEILPSDPELWGCAIFGPKMSPFPKWEFFQKSCLWASFLLFMPIYMPKIKVRYYSISEILMIKEYWDLIGPEPFLSLTWKIDFSQACSFCRMLINHKNSDFTLIPDKTSYMILLKIPKTMFLGHFWPFLPDEDSLKKIQRCYRQLHMGP